MSLLKYLDDDEDGPDGLEGMKFSERMKQGIAVVGVGGAVAIAGYAFRNQIRDVWRKITGHDSEREIQEKRLDDASEVVQVPSEFVGPSGGPDFEDDAFSRDNIIADRAVGWDPNEERMKERAMASSAPAVPSSSGSSSSPSSSPGVPDIDVSGFDTVHRPGSADEELMLDIMSDEASNVLPKDYELEDLL